VSMNAMINCEVGDDMVLSYEDVCVVTCNTGYEIQAGNPMRTCQSDGTFNGTDVICVRGIYHKLP